MRRKLPMVPSSIPSADSLITAPLLPAQAAETPAHGTLIESRRRRPYTREQLDADYQRLDQHARYEIRLFRVMNQSQISPDLEHLGLPWNSLQGEE